MKTTIQSFFTFVKKPAPILKNDKKIFVKDFFIALAICLLGLIFSVVLSFVLGYVTETLIGKNIFVEVLDHRVKNTLQAVYSYWAYIAIITLVAPLFEELAYRLFLKSTPTTIAISLFFLLTTLFTYVYLLPLSHNTQEIGLIIAFAFISMGVFYWLAKNTHWLDILSCRYGYVFYFSVLFFGLSHIQNYHLTGLQYLLAPIITLPQIIYGIVFGYFRIKNGFVFSLLLHGTINAIGLIPLILK